MPEALLEDQAWELAQEGEEVTVTYLSQQSETLQERSGLITERDEPPAPCKSWVRLEDGDQCIQVHLLDRQVSRYYPEGLDRNRGDASYQDLGSLLSLEADGEKVYFPPVTLELAVEQVQMGEDDVELVEEHTSCGTHLILSADPWEDDAQAYVKVCPSCLDRVEEVRV